jgi:hypothetical protein
MDDGRDCCGVPVTASQSQGKDIGYILAQEAPQAFTEGVVNVDSQ